MTQYPALHMIIDGEKVSGGGRRTFDVVNPATGEPIGALPLAEPADLDRALEVAAKGFRIWRKSTPQRARRGAAGRRAADARARRRHRPHRDDGAGQAASPRAAIEADDERRPVQLLRRRVLPRSTAASWSGPTGMRSTVRHEPVGPVAAFAPWNFPLGNPGRKLGAPIAAGCSVIMKAAEETPASALGVLQCLLDAGLPKEVAQAVFGVPDEVSRHLLGSPGHPQAQLHRLDRGRQAPRQARRRRHEAHDDGARRPRPGAGVRRCRRRQGARYRGAPASTATPARSASRRPASSSRRTCSSASATASSSGRRR